MEVKGLKYTTGVKAGTFIALCQLCIDLHQCRPNVVWPPCANQKILTTVEVHTSQTVSASKGPVNAIQNVFKHLVLFADTAPKEMECRLKYALETLPLPGTHPAAHICLNLFQHH